MRGDISEKCTFGDGGKVICEPCRRGADNPATPSHVLALGTTNVWISESIDTTQHVPWNYSGKPIKCGRISPPGAFQGDVVRGDGGDISVQRGLGQTPNEIPRSTRRRLYVLALVGGGKSVGGWVQRDIMKKLPSPWCSIPSILGETRQASCRSTKQLEIATKLAISIVPVTQQ